MLLQYIDKFLGKFIPSDTVLCALPSNSEYNLPAVSHSVLQVKMMTEHGPLTLEAMSTPHIRLAEMRVGMCFRMMSSESQLMVGQR